jgi:hypothetical protein
VLTPSCCRDVFGVDADVATIRGDHQALVFSSLSQRSGGMFI